MRFYQTACLVTLSVFATALPSVAQITDAEGRIFQRSEQNAVNLGSGITSVQDNEQSVRQGIDGNSTTTGSTLATGEIIQDDRQNVGNIGNDIFSIQRNRTVGGQDLDGFSITVP